MDTQLLLTLIGAGVALVSALILLTLNSMRGSINRLETATTTRLDKQDTVIEKIKDALAELKDSMRDRQDDRQGALIAQIETTEQELHRFQTQVLSANVTKEECQHTVHDLKQLIRALEKALREVNAVTREQSLILARIDQAVKSL